MTLYFLNVMSWRYDLMWFLCVAKWSALTHVVGIAYPDLKKSKFCELTLCSNLTELLVMAHQKSVAHCQCCRTQMYFYLQINPIYVYIDKIQHNDFIYIQLISAIRLLCVQVVCFIFVCLLCLFRLTIWAGDVSYFILVASAVN